MSKIIKFFNGLYVFYIRMHRYLKKNIINFLILIVSLGLLYFVDKFVFNPVLVVASPGIALITFYITHYIFNSKNIKNKKEILKENIGFSRFFKIFVNVAFEEIIFRGIIQYKLTKFMDNVFIALLFSFAIFIIFHITRKRNLYYIVDITIFSFVSTGIFFVFEDILSMICIHSIRNILIEKYNLYHVRKIHQNKQTLVY